MRTSHDQNRSLTISASNVLRLPVDARLVTIARRPLAGRAVRKTTVGFGDERPARTGRRANCKLLGLSGSMPPSVRNY